MQVKVRLGSGAHAFLVEPASVEVVAGQTVQLQLEASRAWGGVVGLFKPDLSWAPLGFSSSHGLDLKSSGPRVGWRDSMAYVYKPTYRLYRRGELVFEVDDLWDVAPLDDLEGPFELEIEHEALELFRSEPFHPISYVKAAVRGHCSMHLVVTSAATGQRVTDASVVVSRVGPEIFQQVHTLGRNATITGLPPEKFSVLIVAPGHAPRTVAVPELTNHERREVQVELLPAMGVHGSVVYQNRPAPAVSLELQVWKENEWQRVRAEFWPARQPTRTTDALGTFRLEASEPGTYRVQVQYGTRPYSREFDPTPGEFIDVGTLVLEFPASPTSR